jgi:TolB-like protein
LKYRERPSDLPTIGHKLGIRYVLTGTICSTNAQIRISAELADAETLGVLWTDRVTGDLSDLFAVQDRFTERVIQTIAPHIYGQKSGALLASERKISMHTIIHCVALT